MQNEAGQLENVESRLVEVDDASQVGGKQADVEEVPVDSAYKHRVMEDLDALLADLQNTTASISSYQKSHNQQQYQPYQQQQDHLDQQHNHVHHNNTATGDLRHSGQSSSSSNRDHHNGDHSSSSPDQSSVYEHQHIDSTVNQTKNQDSISAEAQAQPVVTASQDSYNSSGGNSGSSTPPPLPPPPDFLEYNRDFEPVYEQQTFLVRETTPSSSSNTSSDKADVQERTQVKDRGERMSALSNNLSELDQLLLDLNSAQFLAEVENKSTKASEVTVVNSSTIKQAPPVAPKPSSKPIQRTSVDNLLDDLEIVEPQPIRYPAESNYQELSTITASHTQPENGVAGTVYRATSTSSASSTSSYYQPQSASTATKELDDLMMSLSEFRSKGDGVASSNEPAYAKPVKSRTASDASPTSPHETGGSAPELGQLQGQRGVHQIQRENGLEVMLGDLQSDLNRQGVNIRQKGVCAACQKPIVGQVIAALGRTWHVEHFVCAHCEEPLGTRNFYERDSLAYCEKDYHQLFAPRCAYCNGAIVDKCITALEKMWHPEHFFCAQCGRPFGEEDFHEKNGKAYCREDYFQMFAPKCGGCAHPILENYISALNRQWHPECFVCWDCRSHFGAGSFYDYEGLPYCETHYHAKKGSLCASCERPITGRCITAMFRKFHPEHFVCAFCLKQLNKGTFKEQNDKPYCHPCFVKLFG